MDDLLTFRKDEKRDFRHPKEVLNQLSNHRLYVSPEKCEFLKKQIEFLCSTAGQNHFKGNRKVDVVKT